MHIWLYLIFVFGLFIYPMLSKRGLFDGNVLRLLCDLPFRDNLSPFQVGPFGEPKWDPGLKNLPQTFQLPKIKIYVILGNYEYEYDILPNRRI